MSARPVIRQLAQLDDFASLATNHAHAASVITSGTFATARIPPVTAAMVAADVATQAELDASALLGVLKAPADATRNLVVPTADVPAVTTRAFATQTQPLWLVEDSGAQDVLRLVVPGFFNPGNNLSAVRLEMPSTGVGTSQATTRYNGLPYGPTGLVYTGQTYTGEPDPCIYMGYNLSAFESEVIKNRGGWAVWGVEGNAFWGGGVYEHEMYAEMTNEGATPGAAATIGHRPFFARMNTAAGGTPSTRFGRTYVTGNPLTLGVPNDTAPFTPGLAPHQTLIELSYGPPRLVQFTGKFNFVALDNTQPLVTFAGLPGQTGALAVFDNGTGVSTEFSADGIAKNSKGMFYVDLTTQNTAFLARRNGANAWFVDTEGHTTWKAGATLTVGTKTLLDADGRLYMTGKYVEVDLAAQDTAFLARRSGVNGWYVDTEGHMTFKDGATIAAGTTNGLKIGTGATNRLAFYGGTARAQPTALTAADAGTVSIVWGAAEQGILNNVRTRLNEIAARLNSSGTGLSLIAGTN